MLGGGRGIYHTECGTCDDEERKRFECRRNWWYYSSGEAIGTVSAEGEAVSSEGGGCFNGSGVRPGSEGANTTAAATTAGAMAPSIEVCMEEEGELNCNARDALTPADWNGL